MTLDPIATAAITPYLRAGEPLLWSGRPVLRSGWATRLMLIVFAIHCAVLFGALALAPRARGDEFLPVVIGLCGPVYLHFYHYCLAPRQSYGITDRRAILVRTGLLADVFLFDLRAGTSFYLVDDIEGVKGTIYLDVAEPPWRCPPIRRLTARYWPPVFYDIDRPGEVLALLKRRCRS